MSFKYAFYRPGNTLFHRLDPRTKMLLILLVIPPVVLTFTDPLWLLAMLLLTIAVVRIVGVNLSSVMGIIKYVFYLTWLVVIFMSLTPTLWYPHELLHFVWKTSIFGFTYGLAWEGFAMGVGMLLRILSLMVLVSSFFATMAPRDFVHGLVKMKVPYIVGLAGSLSLRMFPTFIGDFLTITEAQRARALELEKGNIIERGRKFLAVAAPLLMIALMRADQLNVALVSRGFGALPPEKRTAIKEYSMKKIDYAVLLITIILGTLAFYARYVLNWGTLAWYRF